MVSFSIEQAQRELAEQAALLQVDPTRWAKVLELWATTHSRNALGQVPGYHSTSMMSRKDFRTLQDGDMLRDEVMTQAGIRITATAQHAVFYTSLALELVAPFQAGSMDGRPNGRMLSKKWYPKLAKNPPPATGYRKLGAEVTLLVAVHYVPGHWCFISADFRRRRFVYYDPLYGGAHATGARHSFSAHLKEELARQGCEDFDVDSFELVTVTRPKQPDGVSCGVCVLMAMEVLVSQGAEAFDEFVADHDGKWTHLEIRCARARWACELSVAPGAAVHEALEEAGQAELENFVDLSDD